MNKTTAVVLAAGYGKRMKSSFPKVLCEVCGQPLIYYTLKSLSRMRSIEQIIIVVGYQGGLIKEVVNKICSTEFRNLLGKIQFIHQLRLLGTADAVKEALGKIKFKEVLVTCGDNPLIKPKTFSSFLFFSRRKNADCCILTSFFKRKNQLGAVLCDGKGKPKAIEEKNSVSTKSIKNQTCINRVNSGTYYFKKINLSKYLDRIKKDKKKREYFLTDIIKILYSQGKKIESYLAKDSQETAGINKPEELQFAQEVIRKRIIDQLINKGVNIIHPQTTIIQESVKVGANTTIYPFTFIEKGVIIGSNCSVGPFVHIRGGTRIKKGAQVGNFLEINRSQLGRGAKAKHFGYLGDCVVSDRANIGAGVVVANYDGKNKHKTYIKKDALIGSDTVLVAPVTVGEGAVTGAGAVVTKNIKKNQVVAGIPARFLKNKE